ncbi:MAG: GGDEF domain-containing protein [Candidatus Micrarchaeota archaeon]
MNNANPRRLFRPARLIALRRMKQGREERSRLRRALFQEQKLRKEAEERCITDPLTGAFNRRGLEMRFAEEQSKAKRFGRGLCLVFFDVDNFKAFNSEHGQQSGDIVLKGMVGAIRSVLRPYDSVHRYGGEEFIVILPEVSSDWDACSVAERIRRRIEAVELVSFDGSAGLRVTASLGVASLRDGDSLESLIERANRAEMEAKRRGKNRTCVFSGDGIREAGAAAG